MSYSYVPQYSPDEVDLSESDCPSDSQVMQHMTADFTELYRRKHRARNHSGTYYHMPSYYDHQARLPTTCTCNLPPDPRYCYYKAIPQSQEGMFKSSTQITSNLRSCQDVKPTSTATFRKYPITARTPRYYRCAPAPLCKRPSALCLPVACQPDPASSAPQQRPRASKAPSSTAEIQHYRGQETAYAINDYVMRTTATTAVKRTTDTRPVDSEGDVNSRLNDLENLLTKFDDDADDENENENEKVEITAVSDISKILKPKVPASVKAKQEKVLKLRAVKTNLTETLVPSEKVNKLEVKEAPEEPLELILQRLHKDVPRDNNEDKRSDKPAQNEQIAAREKQTLYSEQKPPLDDTSALELHKSKSYIVSLIDKALSKELGTIPGDKCTRKEFMNMNPKKAVDLVNRHSFVGSECERAMSLNVAQSSSKKEEHCSCKSEEPMYLKQLKQLRWSHLRHIQREAKRLADLEKFLDSFTETDSPT